MNCGRNALQYVKPRYLTTIWASIARTMIALPLQLIGQYHAAFTLRPGEREQLELDIDSFEPDSKYASSTQFVSKSYVKSRKYWGSTKLWCYSGKFEVRILTNGSYSYPKYTVYWNLLCLLYYRIKKCTLLDPFDWDKFCLRNSGRVATGLALVIAANLINKWHWQFRKNAGYTFVWRYFVFSVTNRERNTFLTLM
jgi:hypothetical protein